VAMARFDLGSFVAGLPAGAVVGAVLALVVVVYLTRRR
jgi:hypothetical protein